MNPKDLEQRLHAQIPVSKFMQVEVTRLDPDVELQCDLAPNHNHLGTAFGGSLSTMMILAAYCQIFKLIDAQGHVVLKSGEMKYLKPVHEKLRAVCKIPLANNIEAFLKTYHKKGRARLHLESQIVLQDDQVACTMKMEFVGVYA